MNQLTPAQKLLQLMNAKGYLAVEGTYTEQPWFDSSFTSSHTVTAEIVEGQLIVTVDGMNPVNPDAYIMSVVRKGQFHATKFAPQAVDLDDFFVLTKERAHELHVLIGQMCKKAGLKKFNQEQAASDALDREVTGFTGLTEREAQLVLEHVAACLTVFCNTNPGYADFQVVA